MSNIRPSSSNTQPLDSNLIANRILGEAPEIQAIPTLPEDPSKVHLPYRQDDNAQLSQQGAALPTISLDTDPPAWTAGQKASIVSSFQNGLKTYDLSPAEITATLRQFGISNLEMTLENIQNPVYAEEIEHIQLALNERLNHEELRALGQGNQIGHDGQFGKNSVAAVAKLRSAIRGNPIELKVDPIKQQTSTGCYRTAEAMMYNVVHGKDGQSDAYGEFDLRSRVRDQDRTIGQVYAASKENSAGRVSVSFSRASEMLDTIDSELENGRPVIAGVSYRKQNGREYNEGITDHFVLVSGRGYDEAGTFYTFQDPAGGGTHKLRLDPGTGRLSGKGDMRGVYDVTLIQHATDIDSETIEHYQKLGKTLYSQGETSRELGWVQNQLTQMGFDTKGIQGGYGNGTANAVRQFQEAHNLPTTGSSIDNHTADAIAASFKEHQAANPTTVIFARGANNAHISALQKILTEEGFNTKGTNGSFGPGTEAAVKAFQLANGIVDSGKIDNQTMLAILARKTE